MRNMMSEDDETTAHDNVAFEDIMPIDDEMTEMMHDVYGFEF